MKRVRARNNSAVASAARSAGNALRGMGSNAAKGAMGAVKNMMRGGGTGNAQAGRTATPPRNRVTLGGPRVRRGGK